MQTQAAGHREQSHLSSLICRTMVHSARTPTTRPLPRSAAIASRHATSRAMQVTSALLLYRRLLLPPSIHHTAHVSLSRSCKPTCKALHCITQRGGRGSHHNVQSQARVDDASLRWRHQALVHTLATPSLPLKSQAVVLWPGLMRHSQPTTPGAGRWAAAHAHLGRWGLWTATGAAAASRADRRSMQREGGARARGAGGGPSRHVGTERCSEREAGLEASMAHVRQDAASGWSLGPDMTCLPCLR
jgi:hypothetical protein